MRTSTTLPMSGNKPEAEVSGESQHWISVEMLGSGKAQKKTYATIARKKMFLKIPISTWSTQAIPDNLKQFFGPWTLAPCDLPCLGEDRQSWGVNLWSMPQRWQEQLGCPVSLQDAGIPIVFIRRMWMDMCFSYVFLIWWITKSWSCFNTQMV